MSDPASPLSSCPDLFRASTSLRRPPVPAHTAMPRDVDARNKSGHDGSKAETVPRAGHASASPRARAHTPVKTCIKAPTKKQLATYPLRLPASLKVAVAEVARRDGTSINQFVTTAVAEKLSAMRTAEFFAERRTSADIEEARRILFRDVGKPPEPEDRLP